MPKKKLNNLLVFRRQTARIKNGNEEEVRQSVDKVIKDFVAGIEKDGYQVFTGISWTAEFVNQEKEADLDIRTLIKPKERKKRKKKESSAEATT